MHKPFFLSIAPDRLKASLFARHYRARRHKWLHLYQDAPLKFAPRVSMSALLPGDVISDSIALTGMYELEASRRTRELAARGGVMIDVGANLGYFSLLWAAARRDNRVVAFEASPRNVPLLRRNIERNNLGSRIDVAAVAVGRAPGKLAFSLGPQDQTGWGGITLDAANDNITVDVVRIDDFLGGVPKIALLKIDIEGADTWALQGCERLLRTGRVQEIWFEANKPRMRLLGIEEDAAAKFLKAVNYTASPVGSTAGDLVEWRAVPGGGNQAALAI
jgi:FkbM family methyltransferase